ncbi:unnamed protein product, partial [Brassica rapa]
MLHTRTAKDVLCVLTDTHGRHVEIVFWHDLSQVWHDPSQVWHGEKHKPRSCADGHTRTAMDIMCVLTDSHGRPVCAGGHPQTSYTAHVGQNHPNS